MDQNSTNGTGADKRNWRERLGIGAKEMPKLSEEFKSPPSPQPPPAGAARPAPRSPQPVTKPAPMAPRAAQRPPEPVQQAAAQPQRGPDPAAQDALAQKLRAQRAAAEKLAEQRVQAARERAEAKSAAPEPSLSIPQRAPAKPAAPPPPPPTAARSVPPPLAAPAGRPKFSFAEDEGAARREPRPSPETPQPPRPALGAPPPLTPPRPALGGERSQPPFLRQSTVPGARIQPPAYRPIEPSTGYPPPPRPAAIQPPPPRNYGADPGAGPGFGSTRPPVRRPPAVDPYARSGEPRGFAGDEFEDDTRNAPRLNRPPALSGRGRPRPVDEDHEEVFEDAPLPRQRASARDYQNAYREQDGGYEEEQRRSSGPWLLLLALLVAGLVTGGVVWFYNTQMKNVAGTGTSTSGQVPVVEAPADPAKTAPEQPADAQGEAPAVKRKQIYDRIVGDQEVTGDQVLPTEEIPVQPAAAEPANVDQIPAPDLPPATGAAVDEPAPLPLPPPPGNDQQGSLDQTGIEKIAAAAAQPEQGATAPPAPLPGTDASTMSTAALPPPEPTSAGAETTSAEQVEKPEVIVKPAKKKEVAAKETAAPAKKKAVAPVSDEQNFGAEPVVLVPPAQPIAPPSQNEAAISSEPISQQGAGGAAPVKKKKTIMDLFRGSSDTEPAAAAEETQVAAVQPKAAPQAKPAPAPAPVEEPAPQQASAGGSGYVVQLASFRSQAEAQSEYGRLSSLYPTVVGGLPQRVAQSKVGGSTRYQLGLGPIKNRSEATRVCSALFQAGERDCIVRSQ